MTKAATLTLRVSEELKDKLSKLAEQTQRTPSALANKALTAFVDHQLWMLAEIDKSLEDFEEGRTVTHEEAMARLRATIARHDKSAA